jgi:hypothetical protein
MKRFFSFAGMFVSGIASGLFVILLTYFVFSALDHTRLLQEHRFALNMLLLAGPFSLALLGLAVYIQRMKKNSLLSAAFCLGFTLVMSLCGLLYGALLGAAFVLCGGGAGR